MTQVFPNREACPKCGGTGDIDDDDGASCEGCDGTGEICGKCRAALFNCWCDETPAENEKPRE